MAITIYKSTERRQSSNAKDTLNDLAEFWDTENWGEIERDETTDNVTALWVSEKIKITLGSSSSTFKVGHVPHNRYLDLTGSFNSFGVIKTDTALQCIFYPSSSGYGSQFILIGRVIDLNDSITYGVICRQMGNNPYVNVFTDNMPDIGIANCIINLPNNQYSEYWTVLDPIYCSKNDERFADDLMIARMRPQNTGGKTQLGGDKWYFIPNSWGGTQYNTIAMKFTE